KCARTQGRRRMARVWAGGRMETQAEKRTSVDATERPADVLRAEDVTKVYGAGEARVRALDDVSIAFAEQRFTAIMGPSGSGKSTLMHCLAGLDSVTSGRILLGDQELTAMSDRELTILRRERMGFVFQSFNLLPAF